jgi:hypothetical protein
LGFGAARHDGDETTGSTLRGRLRLGGAQPGLAWGRLRRRLRGGGPERQPGGHSLRELLGLDAAHHKRAGHTLAYCLLVGLLLGRAHYASPGAAADAAEPAVAHRAAVNATRLPPNEAGRIMVFMYHRVGDPASAPDLTISPADFRAQLDYLYEHGYHPVNLRDLFEWDLDVPAGKTPVVLTFDDSSDSQLTMEERDGEWVPTPDSAVGILTAFSAEHPDWPMRGTFFVLPEAAPPNNLFDQPELAEVKLRYLVDHGMEIGNHTLWHADLATAGFGQVIDQLAAADTAIGELVPDYDVVSLALPYGNYPANEGILRAGDGARGAYRFAGAVEAMGGPSYPPGDDRFDPFHVPRIQPEPQKGIAETAFWWFEAHPGDRWVSDGDPATLTVPTGAAGHLDRHLLDAAGIAVVEY